jgi:hypothetical protein
LPLTERIFLRTSLRYQLVGRILVPGHAEQIGKIATIESIEARLVKISLSAYGG